MGTVEKIAGPLVTIETPAGVEVVVSVPAGAPVLQLAPGSTDLRAATPSSLEKIAVGDRILVSGSAGEATGGPSKVTATRIVVMKSGEIAARNVASEEDWRRRGKSGVVEAVDASTITLAVGGGGGASAAKRVLKIETSGKTIFRRYAADSINFGDARPGTLAQIRAGDQVVARGALEKAEGAGEAIEAEEVVSGAFMNLSGPITSVDAAEKSFTVRDAASKKMVTVKVSARSDLRRLPADYAADRAGAGADAKHPAGGDLSRMLPQFPVDTLAGLHAGEAVLVVASQGAAADQFTAITVLSGVERLLQGAAAGAKTPTLSPWNVFSPDGGS